MSWDGLEDLEAERRLFAERRAEKMAERLRANGLCRCGNPGKPDHICPYAADINNDEKTLCNCCDDCSYECAMDV